MTTAPLVLGHPMRVALLGGELVANRLRARPPLRLILPTGHTPLGMYAVLRGHAADGSLPAEQATLFQLDEYLGLGAATTRAATAPTCVASCAASTSAPSTASTGPRPTRRPSARATRRCSTRRRSTSSCSGSAATDTSRSTSPARRSARGAARAPPSDRRARTRRPTSAGSSACPREALTVGLRTLLGARELLMLVSGAAKAAALRAMLEDEPGADCPASLLRDHPRLTVDLRRAAAARCCARSRAGRATAR